MDLRQMIGALLGREVEQPDERIAGPAVGNELQRFRARYPAADGPETDALTDAYTFDGGHGETGPTSETE